MVSKMAMEDIESLHEQGIDLTPQEIIRLNAFGLKVERATDSVEHFALPRVAILGNIVLREPTVGSEIWMHKAGQVFDMTHVDTWTTLRVYSLSKDQAELPDPFDKKKMSDEIQSLVMLLKPYTFNQMITALNYAVQGDLPWNGEDRGKKKTCEDEDGEELDDENSCVEVGMLNNGMVLRLGSIEEMKGLTTSTMHMLIQYKSEIDFMEASVKDHKNQRLGNYYLVLDEIKEAHMKGKDNG